MLSKKTQLFWPNVKNTLKREAQERVCGRGRSTENVKFSFMQHQAEEQISSGWSKIKIFYIVASLLMKMCVVPIQDKRRERHTL